MPDMLTLKKVPLEKLRWRLDLDALTFKNTNELEPLREIIGQKRGVEAFHFGMQMKQSGYNVFVTGTPGSGRMATVRKLLEHLSKEDGRIPDDLCYVNILKARKRRCCCASGPVRARPSKKTSANSARPSKKKCPACLKARNT